MKQTLFVILFSLFAFFSLEAQTMPVYVGSLGSSGDMLISAGAGNQPAFTTARQFSALTANDSNTTTTMAKSPLSFVAAANATYKVKIHLKDSVSASTGLTFDIYALGAIGSINGTIMGSKKSDTCGFGSIVADSTASSAFTTYVPTTNYGVQDIDLIFVNGAVAQTVWLRYAKPTSGTAILKAGSYLEAWKQ